MLDLHNVRWSELTHAYGEASDIPPLIEQLKTAPVSVNYQSEPWFSLWSALCHQANIFDASYAAVPHIVSIAGDKSPTERIEFIHFVSAVEAYRYKLKAPLLPSDLKQSYLSALEHVSTLILECLQKDWDEAEYRILFGALAIVRGKYKMGWAITELESKTICPVCENEFTTSGYDLLD